MRDVRELLDAAAPQVRRSVDLESVRRRVRRRRQRRLTVATLVVLAVVGVGAAFAAPRLSDSDPVADPTGEPLWCGLVYGERSYTTLLDPGIGPATATVDPYRAVFSVVTPAGEQPRLRVDLYGPPQPGVGPNPSLPDGVILRAEGGFPPEGRDVDDPLLEFGIGSYGGGERVTGGCGTEPWSFLPRTRVAIGSNPGEVGYLEPKALEQNPEAQDDGPFDVYDQPEGGVVIAWWFHSVGLREPGDHPTEAERRAAIDR